MDAVPIVPPLFRAAKTRHFTSYKQATDHELLTRIIGGVDLASKAINNWRRFSAYRGGRRRHIWVAHYSRSLHRFGFAGGAPLTVSILGDPDALHHLDDARRLADFSQFIKGGAGEVVLLAPLVNRCGGNRA